MGILRILVIDDDVDFADSMREALQLKGHEVIVGNSGEQALELIRTERFDITFMDIRLPGMNGVESFLHAKKMRADARVVMVTGYAVEELVEQAVENGAWGVLNKPLDLDELFRMLEKIEPKGILLADDDEDFIHGVKDALQDKGYTVFTAHDGQQAVDQARRGQYGVLLLDLRMPLINGLDVFLQLKGSGDELPTIIVTAYASEENDALMKLKSMEITGVLTKPFDITELNEMLKQQFDNS